MKKELLNMTNLKWSAKPGERKGEHQRAEWDQDMSALKGQNSNCEFVYNTRKNGLYQV